MLYLEPTIMDYVVANYCACNSHRRRIAINSPATRRALRAHPTTNMFSLPQPEEEEVGEAWDPDECMLPGDAGVMAVVAAPDEGTILVKVGTDWRYVTTRSLRRKKEHTSPVPMTWLKLSHTEYPNTSDSVAGTEMQLVLPRNPHV